MARKAIIKPEFWNSPIFGKLSDESKLMAISLLNYSEKDGTFCADISLIKGFCRPFDNDSSLTSKCIDELLNINYISIDKSNFANPVGMIEKLKEVSMAAINKSNMPNSKEFIPPTLDEVISYFLSNWYRKDIAIKAFNYYNVADWHDSKGNKIRNWKQKMQAVWFKEENRIKQEFKSAFDNFK